MPCKRAKRRPGESTEQYAVRTIQLATAEIATLRAELVRERERRERAEEQLKTASRAWAVRVDDMVAAQAERDAALSRLAEAEKALEPLDDAISDALAAILPIEHGTVAWAEAERTRADLRKAWDEFRSALFRLRERVWEQVTA